MQQVTAASGIREKPEWMAALFQRIKAVDDGYATFGQLLTDRNCRRTGLSIGAARNRCTSQRRRQTPPLSEPFSEGYVKAVLGVSNKMIRVCFMLGEKSSPSFGLSGQVTRASNIVKRLVSVQRFLFLLALRPPFHRQAEHAGDTA